MKRYLGLICLVIAFLGAALAGWVDFHNDEPQAALLVIFVFTVLLGFLLPKRAWLWAIIVGLGVPGMYFVLRTLGYQSVGVPSPGWYASLIALIPAFIGAYFGAAGRWILHSMLQRA